MLPEAAAAQLYIPIQSWQTRVLCLQPGQAEEPLVATLQVGALIHDSGVALDWHSSEIVTYEAISYTWGSASSLHSIAVNNALTFVNASLAGALRRFRLTNTVRWLWADQLCINQSDVAEKSVQVQNMFKIFRKAKHVLAWLGPLEGYQELTAEEMRLSRDAAFEHRLKYASTLCASPWPFRAWVQQEVFAARELTLFCGPMEMTLDEYKRVVHNTHRWDIERRTRQAPGLDRVLAGLRASPENVAALERAKVVMASQTLEDVYERRMKPRMSQAEKNARADAAFRNESPTAMAAVWEDEADERRCEDEWEAVKRTRLELVLTRSCELAVSDPRDHVYALVGMSHERTSSNVMSGGGPNDLTSSGVGLYIDYSRSTKQVFQDAMKCILLRNRSLWLLERCREYIAEDFPGSGLASWAVDWRDTRLETVHEALRFPLIDPDAVRLRWRPSDNENVLRIEGYRVAEIMSVRARAALAGKRHGDMLLAVETHLQPASVTPGSGRRHAAADIRARGETRVTAWRGQPSRVYWGAIDLPYQPSTRDLLARLTGSESIALLRRQPNGSFRIAGFVPSYQLRSADASTVGDFLDSAVQISNLEPVEMLQKDLVTETYPEAVEVFDLE
jgi:hypothetical protein